MYLNSVFTNLYSTSECFQRSLFSQTGQHIDQSKLVISEHYSSSSDCIPILIKVQQVISSFCIQIDLLLFLSAQTVTKTCPEHYHGHHHVYICSVTDKTILPELITIL